MAWLRVLLVQKHLFYGDKCITNTGILTITAQETFNMLVIDTQLHELVIKMIEEIETHDYKIVYVIAVAMISTM